MKIVVDANIVYSAILNIHSKHSQLLINSGKHFQFITSDLLDIEIRKYFKKISEYTELTTIEIEDLYQIVIRNIQFVPDHLINATIWKRADELVADIDPKDAIYLALAIQNNCKIWSGDKQLSKKLRALGHDKIITTKELITIRDEKLKPRE